MSRFYTKIFKKVPDEGSLCLEFTQEYLKRCLKKGSLYQDFTQEYLKRRLIQGPYIKNLHKNI